MKRSFALSVSLLAVFCLSTSVLSASSDEIVTAFETIHNPQLDPAAVYHVSGLVLEATDVKLHLDSGVFHFINKIKLDSLEFSPGGIFKGKGRFEFHPGVKMEQDQLKKFFDSDSLYREFDNAQLLFTSAYAEQIIRNSVSFPEISKRKLKNTKKKMKSFNKLMSWHGEMSYHIGALKNIVETRSKQFLLMNIELKKGGKVIYLYDPTLREQVRFLKHKYRADYQYMELICSYYEALDESYRNINGNIRDQKAVNHFEIDASIDTKGRYSGRTDMFMPITRTGTQLLKMSLHPELRVDSIKDSTGNQINFLRHDKRDHWRSGLYLIFDRPLIKGKTIKISFFYQGDIAKRDLGEFYVNAGADWYPWDGHSRRATFDIKFKTPKWFDFTATGNQTDERIIGDTLFTRWEVTSPCYNVSFNIGNMKKYEFVEEGVPGVEVHYSKDLHNLLGIYLSSELVSTGRNMQNQVADDIINSLKLFSHYFGEYPQEKLVVSEVLAYHGESFPGFLHLGFQTWINTDPWGNDRLFRAHEVAHQWWGTGVGYETYHDQWLSEGFATYSALMYLQAVSGNDKFFKKLREYRDDIFSVRKYLFSSGKESGPMALGHRTSSSKTRGDYGLVIYRKGAYILHMLRNLLIDLKAMNEDLFFDMLKEFYQSNFGKDVNTRQFQKHVESYAGIDMTWFFNQWVYGTDLPKYKFKYVLNKKDDGYYYADCRIEQSEVSEDFKMFVPIEIEFESGGKAYLRVMVDKPLVQLTLPPLEEKPKKIRLNPFESVLAKVEQ